VETQTSARDSATTPRLHYLDWLRVLAIFLVFVFHAIHVFDFGGWQIKNAEQSELITIILTLLSLWGMPFFFLVAGAASWFALLKRTPRQYLSERFKRLAIPYVVGSLLFSPLQYYLWWKNQVFLGNAGLTFPEFMRIELPPSIRRGCVPRVSARADSAPGFTCGSSASCSCSPCSPCRSSAG